MRTGNIKELECDVGDAFDRLLPGCNLCRANSNGYKLKFKFDLKTPQNPANFVKEVVSGMLWFERGLGGESHIHPSRCEVAEFGPGQQAHFHATWDTRWIFWWGSWAFPPLDPIPRVTSLVQILQKSFLGWLTISGWKYSKETQIRFGHFVFTFVYNFWIDQLDSSGEARRTSWWLAQFWVFFRVVQ